MYIKYKLLISKNIYIADFFRWLCPKVGYISIY
jgi:hypothetical protein